MHVPCTLPTLSLTTPNPWSSILPIVDPYRDLSSTGDGAQNPPQTTDSEPNSNMPISNTDNWQSLPGSANHYWSIATAAAAALNEIRTYDSGLYQAQPPPVQPNTAHQIDAYPNYNYAPMILPQNLNPSFHGQQIPQVFGADNANTTSVSSSTASKTSRTDSGNFPSTSQTTSKTTTKRKFGIYICEMVNIWW